MFVGDGVMPCYRSSVLNSTTKVWSEIYGGISKDLIHVLQLEIRNQVFSEIEETCKITSGQRFV